MKIKLILGLMSAVFAFCPPHLAEAREFTSSSGKVLIADIVFVAGNTATLKRPDGKTVDVPLKMFSEDDQKFILEWKEKNKGKVPEHLKNKKPRMGFKVTTGKTSKKDDQISGYIDEHKQKLHIKVSLENQDTVYPISDAKLTILVIGKSPESGKEAIVYKKQFSGINLPINEEKVLRVINLSYGMTTEARCMVINTKAALLFLKTLRVRYLVKRRFQEQRPNIWKRRKN